MKETSRDKITNVDKSNQQIDKSEPKKFVRKQIESYAQRNSIKSTRSNQ